MKNFEISTKNYSIKKENSKYKLTLGNLTDADWFWNGDKTDLGLFFVRIKSSKITNDFIKDMQEKGIKYSDIKKDIINSVKQHGSGVYAISGDNVKWHFGEGIEPDYKAEAEYVAKENKLNAEKLEEKAFSFYSSDYDEFYSEYGKNLQEKLATKLEDASDYDEAFSAIDEIKKDAIYDVLEYEDRKWNDALFRASKELKPKKRPIPEMKGKKGWYRESTRHSLARKGIKTGRKKR